MTSKPRKGSISPDQSVQHERRPNVPPLEQLDSCEEWNEQHCQVKRSVAYLHDAHQKTNGMFAEACKVILPTSQTLKFQQRCISTW